MGTDVIQHTGEIIAIENGMAKVLIMQTSACSSCHAKSVCGASDKKEKIIEAEINSGSFNVGDNVLVVGQKSLGIKAVLLAYVLPFVLMLATMLITSTITEKEWIIGTSTLGVLVPYFILLRLMKDAIQAKFKFYVTMS